MNHAPRAAGGNGLPGYEVVPDSQGRMVGPFAMLASIGPVDLPPGLPKDADVRPHLHIGMGVLAYIEEGEITHRDDLGHVHRHGSGEATWMMCGRGIVHSERLETLRDRGGRVEALVAFVALPPEAEQLPPAWQHLPRESIPVIEQPGATGRLLLGRADGAQADVALHSPAYLIRWTLEPDALLVPQAGYEERAFHILSGEIHHGGETFGRGQLVTLVPGAQGSFRAQGPCQLIEFGGAPVGPRYKWWNFLASRLEAIEEAKRRWLADDRSLPPGETEFTPLPGDDERPLQLLSVGASAAPARQAEEAA